MERFVEVVNGFLPLAVLANGSILVLSLVLIEPLMLFVQRWYFILAPQRVIIYSLLLLRIVLAIAKLRFHGYQYQIF